MNAGATGPLTPPARTRGGRPRRVRIWVALSTLAGVIACTLLVAFGAEAIVSRASCTAHPVVVRLAAAEEIAPAIRHVATFFNAQHQDVNGHCAAVHVISEPSATAAAQIAQSGTSTAFDAWIPDSSLWVSVARSSPAGAQLVQQTGLTVARSPLAIVMPRSVAEQVPAFGASVGWQFLLPAVGGRPGHRPGAARGFPRPGRELGGPGHADRVAAPARLGHGRPGRLHQVRVQRPGHEGRGQRCPGLPGQPGPAAPR